MSTPSNNLFPSFQGGANKVIKWAMRVYFAALLAAPFTSTDVVKASLHAINETFAYENNSQNNSNEEVGENEDTDVKVIYIRTENVSPALMDILKRKFANSIFKLNSPPTPPTGLTVKAINSDN